mmetsp:Transcript_46143/g.117839  ORF Transcript_46143/g.117839 Transcript_46143/m.117839 type:complete len:208 (-) Transcript_46143:55-678(-)
MVSACCWMSWSLAVRISWFSAYHANLASISRTLSACFSFSESISARTVLTRLSSCSIRWRSTPPILPSSSRFSRRSLSISPRSSASFSAAASFVAAISVSSASFSLSFVPAVCTAAAPFSLRSSSCPSRREMSPTRRSSWRLDASLSSLICATAASFSCWYAAISCSCSLISCRSPASSFSVSVTTVAFSASTRPFGAALSSSCRRS